MRTILYSKLVTKIYIKINENTTSANEIIELLQEAFNIISHSTTISEIEIHNKLIDIILEKYPNTEDLLLTCRLNKIPSLEKLFYEDPSNYKNICELGVEYALKGNYHKAKQLLDRVAASEYKEKNFALSYIKKYLT